MAAPHRADGLTTGAPPASGRLGALALRNAYARATFSAASTRASRKGALRMRTPAAS
jgi:hypothetical protein